MFEKWRSTSVGKYVRVDEGSVYLQSGVKNTHMYVSLSRRRGEVPTTVSRNSIQSNRAFGLREYSTLNFHVHTALCKVEG